MINRKRVKELADASPESTPRGDGRFVPRSAAKPPPVVKTRWRKPLPLMLAILALRTWEELAGRWGDFLDARDRFLAAADDAKGRHSRAGRQTAPRLLQGAADKLRQALDANPVFSEGRAAGMREQVLDTIMRIEIEDSGCS